MTNGSNTFVGELHNLIFNGQKTVEMRDFVSLNVV